MFKSKNILFCYGLLKLCRAILRLFEMNQSFTQLTEFCGNEHCIIVTCGILGQAWYLVVSVSDLCRLSYFAKALNRLRICAG